jgi:hypothetical protein
MRRPSLGLIAGLIVGAGLTVVSGRDQGASKAGTAEPVVTPVAGPSWLTRLGLTYRDSSLGRGVARYGPPPTQPAPPAAAAALPLDAR